MNDHQGDRSTMKKLRHPVRMAREPFGTAGLVVAVIALIAALGGTAFAAAKLNSTQKKEVKKIAQTEAKKFAGAGPAGPAGPTGPAGPAGKDGAAGPTGAPGATGATGPAGKNGTNGTNGKDGETGFTETLPSGETETGTWALNQTFVTSNRNVYEPVSFAIPLAESGPAYFFSREATEEEDYGKNGEEKSCKVDASEPECIDTGCRGTVAEPTAPAGTLCVYTSLVEEKERIGGVAKVQNAEGTLNSFGPSGGLIANLFSTSAATFEEPAFIEAFGSWAVTAK